MAIPSTKLTTAISGFIRDDNLEDLSKLLNNATPGVLWHRGNVISHPSYLGDVKVVSIFEALVSKYQGMADSKNGLTMRVRILGGEIQKRLESLDVLANNLNRSSALWVDYKHPIIHTYQFLTKTQFESLFPNQSFTSKISKEQMEQLSAAYIAGKECVTESEPLSVSVTVATNNNVNLLAQINAQNNYRRHIQAGGH